MDHSSSEQNHEELDPGGRGAPEGRRASEPEHSLSKITHNALENIGVLGQGLKQLFQHQRRRSSVSPLGAGSSPSASSTGSPAPEPSEAGPESGDAPLALADTDPHASAHPTALNRVLQQIRGAPMMKRGTSLQSRRSKAAGDPPKGSPQIHRRSTQEALIQAGRPRSSSTTDAPSSPALAEALLTCTYPAAEEPERVPPLSRVRPARSEAARSAIGENTEGSRARRSALGDAAPVTYQHVCGADGKQNRNRCAHPGMCADT
ncbi:transmembrane and coiled-coil domains protein 1-like [Megalops cyprinoides]|uniref:transmembrane and coiled-coil domains protein 1-like n=1 Tax=Megalops cyprinoides TaxID=118141 RepID=UPI001864F906|nr:transmembrane and coiled-coil domains protein 1-like [Megalops cyprinoides]